MNQKDNEILKQLRNGERNISNIARRLKLPVSTASEKVKKIETYITKHSSLLDYSKLGYFANSFLAIKISREQKNLLLDFLKIQSCVNSIFCTNPNYNFLVEVVCKDNLELANWIEDVKSKFSAEIEQFHVLKTEEKEKFVPDGE